MLRGEYMTEGKVTRSYSMRPECRFPSLGAVLSSALVGSPFREP